MRIEERMVGDVPELRFVVRAIPQRPRASTDGLLEHLETGLILGTNDLRVIHRIYLMLSASASTRLTVMQDAVQPVVAGKFPSKTWDVLPIESTLKYPPQGSFTEFFRISPRIRMFYGTAFP